MEVERGKMKGRNLLKWWETGVSISEERAGQKDGSVHILTQSSVVCMCEAGGGRGGEIRGNERRGREEK